MQNISINTCFTDNLCCYLLTLTYVTYTMLLLQFLVNHFPSNLIVRKFDNDRKLMIGM